MFSKNHLTTGYEELANHSILKSDSLNQFLGRASTSQCCAGGTTGFNLMSQFEY